MTELLSFFLVIAAGLVFSAALVRLHVPWAAALIVAGMVIGPGGLNLIELGSAFEILAEIGLVFLMFMAGLEANLKHIVAIWADVGSIALINALVPFVVGVYLASLFGYALTPALLVGAVLLSTSVAVVVPSLTANKLLHTRVGELILGVTVLVDVTSFILLSIILQSANRTAVLPLPLFYILLAALVYVMHWLLPRLKWLGKTYHHRRDIFQRNTRFIIVLLLGIVGLLQLLGVHAVVAGFIAGLLLSELVRSHELKKKLTVIGYGVFIPFFFVVVGAQTDLGSLVAIKGTIMLTIVLVLGSLTAKLLSGWLGARWRGFSSKQSLLIGAYTTPQVTVPLAVAVTGFSLGIFDEALATALVMVAISTSLLGPIIINLLTSQLVTSDELK
ncbi:cation:proton antiporter [Patescibacteria group bacterium]|nr:cation:proton antiporter [Patescibacteria group bacterium]